MLQQIPALLAIFAATAAADPIVYVVTGNLTFGTMDLGSGNFTQIGSGLPAPVAGLVPGPNGNLLTLGANGDLYSIDPADGAAALVGATGLADCSTPTSACGLQSANDLTDLGGNYYATDFANNLYSVNPTTGQATEIGPTSVPQVTFVPFGSQNSDGSFNFFTESFLGYDGSLYATFATGTENPMTGVINAVIGANLYQINPANGNTTLIGPTTFSLDSLAAVNGTIYGVQDDISEIVTMNLSNGATTPVTGFNPATGLIFGATATPEPSSLPLAAAGLMGLILLVLRSRC